MNALQKRKMQWLSRAKSAQQKLLALQALQNQETEFSSAYQETLAQQIFSLLSVREEILRQINTIPDLLLQAILIRRYLNGETMEQIAAAMFYDVRTIQRKHKIALDSLILPVSETTIFTEISCEN